MSQLKGKDNAEKIARANSLLIAIEKAQNAGMDKQAADLRRRLDKLRKTIARTQGPLRPGEERLTLPVEPDKGAASQKSQQRKRKQEIGKAKKWERESEERYRKKKAAADAEHRRIMRKGRER